MDGSIIKHDGTLRDFFPEFMWDPYRITLELSRDPNVIILGTDHYFLWGGGGGVTFFVKKVVHRL